MAKLGDAILYLMTKDEGLKSGLQKAEGDVEQSGGRLSGIMQGIQQGVGQAVFGVVQNMAQTALSAVQGSVDAASDLSESTNKVKVVFGEQAAAILEWSKTTDQALGQSQLQALNAVGTFGNLFVSMGMAGAESKNMSTGLVELASDLASFNNIDPAEALEKLRAGIVGETEPLRSLGVNLSAAAVEAKALSMGLAQADIDMTKVNGATLDVEQAQLKMAEALKKHGAESIQYRQAQQSVAEAEAKLAKALEGSKVELTAAQKAQATYALIMEQTKTAQGDFANTSTGLANQQRIQAAQWENLKTKLGEGLLPIQMQLNAVMGRLVSEVMPPLVTLLVEQVIPAIQSLIDWFTSLSPQTQTTILIIGGLTLAFIALLPAISGVVAALGVLFSPITLIVGAVALLGAAWYNNWFGMRDATDQTIGLILGSFEGLKLGVDLIWQGLKDFWTWLTSIASGTMELLINPPAWITTLVAWTWPLLGPVAWVTALMTWLWPAFIDEPAWVEALRRWLWPEIEDEPSWVGDLVDWLWPEFPTRPQWLQDLLDWVWPSLPSLPSWLGGSDETVAGSSVTGYSLSTRAGGLVAVGAGVGRIGSRAAGGVTINVYQTNNVYKEMDYYRQGRRLAEEVARRVR